MQGEYFVGCAYRLLKMILALRKHGRVKMDDISAEIGATDRQVRRYFNEIRAAGFPIVSKTGKDGGYWLAEPTLTDKEWIILRAVLANHPEIFAKIDYKFNNTI